MKLLNHSLGKSKRGLRYSNMNHKQNAFFRVLWFRQITQHGSSKVVKVQSVISIFNAMHVQLYIPILMGFKCYYCSLPKKKHFFSGAKTLFSKLHYVKVLALVRMLHIILYACSLTSGGEHATKLEKINHCHLVPLSFRRFRKTPSGYPISLFEWDLLVISLKKQRE